MQAIDAVNGVHFIHADSRQHTQRGSFLCDSRKSMKFCLNSMDSIAHFVDWPLT